MFDLGFIKDIRYLLRRLPPPEKRLNMLFSATLSHRVMELAYEHMNEPELIQIEPDKSHRRPCAAGHILSVEPREDAVTRRPHSRNGYGPHHGVRQYQT